MPVTGFAHNLPKACRRRCLGGILLREERTWQCPERCARLVCVILASTADTATVVAAVASLRS